MVSLMVFAGVRKFENGDTINTWKLSGDFNSELYYLGVDIARLVDYAKCSDGSYQVNVMNRPLAKLEKQSGEPGKYLIYGMPTSYAADKVGINKQDYVYLTALGFETMRHNTRSKLGARFK
jgi:hypothetical protein